MKKKLILSLTVLILAFSTTVFADGETGQVGYCGEINHGTCRSDGGGENPDGETGHGNLFDQFLKLFLK